MATVQHHLGDKASLVRELLAAVVASDRVFLASWEKTLRLWHESNTNCPSFAYLEVVDHYLERHLHHAVFVLNILNSPRTESTLSSLLGEWLCVWRHTLQALLGQHEELKADLLVAYLLDDLVFSLTLHRDPSMRMLRFASLQRLMSSGAAPAGAVVTRLFSALHDRLAPTASTLDRLDSLPPKMRSLRDAAAAVALRDGIQAVTHRGVAAKAGVQASTVVHHLGGRDELIVAALEGVIASFKQRLRGDEAEPDENPDATGSLLTVLRGTHGVALAAVSRPSLREHAADMRRRRGENIVPGTQLPDGSRVPLTQDRLGAHLAACCVFGGLCIEAAVPRWLDLNSILSAAHQY